MTKPNRNAITVKLAKKGIRFNPTLPTSELENLLENPPTPQDTENTGGTDGIDKKQLLEEVKAVVGNIVAPLEARIENLEASVEEGNELVQTKS